MAEARGAQTDRVARRIRAPLVTIILVAGALGVVEAVLARGADGAGLWILAFATGGFALSLVPAVMLANRGRPGLAVLTGCVAILFIQCVYLVVYPRAYPALTIASMVVVSFALSYVRGRALFGLVVAAWAIAMAAVLFGTLGEGRFYVPETADVPIVLGSGVAAVTVGMVMLWQFAREMTTAVEEATAAHAQLQVAHQQLAEQERAKSRFINSAAHELNTPMTPILLQLHLLRSGPRRVQDPDQRRMLDVMERNVERTKALVHEMLDVARLQAGRLGLHPKDFDVGDALHAAVDDFSLVAQDKQVELRLAPMPPLPVHADRRRVEQVVSNLVSNAVRVTPGGGHVELSAADDPPNVVVQVRDTGLGLSAEQMRGLFQPFSRVHEEAIQGAGSGLGLYICQGLAKEMGGELWAASPGPGKGATFSLRLPAGSSPPEA